MVKTIARDVTYISWSIARVQKLFNHNQFSVVQFYSGTVILKLINRFANAIVQSKVSAY